MARVDPSSCDGSAILTVVTPQTLNQTPPLPSDGSLQNLAEFRFHLRSFLAFSEQAAEALGVTAQQYQLLQIVALEPEDGPTITHIAQRMLVRHNSAVELIDRAELAGLVSRVHDAGDQRRALIRMTPRGRTTLVQLLRQHTEYLERSGSAMGSALERVMAGGR